MTRILVIGSAGALGAGVVRELMQAHHEVITADLTAPPGETEYAQHVVDVTLEGVVDRVVAEVAPEVVVHLARVDPTGAGDAPGAAARVNVGGTRNVVEAALRHGVRRLVVRSSEAVYGYFADNPSVVTEDDRPRALDTFEPSRQAAVVEGFLEVMRDQYPELEQVVLRTATVLGESMDELDRRLLQRTRLLAVRGADSPFTFLWHDDLVALLAHAATDAPAGVFNVGGDGHLMLDEVADRLGRAAWSVPAGAGGRVLRALRPLGLSPGPELVPYLRDRSILDTSKLSREFGSVPCLSSAEALARWQAFTGE